MKSFKKVKEVAAPKPVKETQGIPTGGVWGILLLFVLVSISYSTYMVVLGTDGDIPKLMVVPQAAFAGIVALLKFANK